MCYPCSENGALQPPEATAVSRHMLKPVRDLCSAAVHSHWDPCGWRVSPKFREASGCGFFQGRLGVLLIFKGSVSLITVFYNICHYTLFLLFSFPSTFSTHPAVPFLPLTPSSDFLSHIFHYPLWPVRFCQLDTNDISVGGEMLPSDWPVHMAVD